MVRYSDGLGESALGCFAAGPKHEHIAEEPVTYQIPAPQALDGFATNYEDRFAARDRRNRQMAVVGL